MHRTDYYRRPKFSHTNPRGHILAKCPNSAPGTRSRPSHSAGCFLRGIHGPNAAEHTCPTHRSLSPQTSSCALPRTWGTTLEALLFGRGFSLAPNSAAYLQPPSRQTLGRNWSRGVAYLPPSSPAPPGKREGHRPAGRRAAHRTPRLQLRPSTVMEGTWLEDGAPGGHTSHAGWRRNLSNRSRKGPAPTRPKKRENKLEEAPVGRTEKSHNVRSPLPRLPLEVPTPTP